MTIAEPEDPGESANLKELLNALGDPSWRSRQSAVNHLLGEQSLELISQLVEVVRDDHRNLSRLNAVIQVLTRTEVDVVPALLPLIAQPDADTRAYVALTLGERGDARAIPVLISALADVDTNVRVHAIEALGKLQAAAAVERLIQFTEQLDFEVAFPALDALTAIRDERIAHRLLPLLDNPLLKTAAIEALGVLGNEESVLFLLGQLVDASVSPGAIAMAVKRIHDRLLARYGSGQSVVEIVRQSASPARIAELRSSIPANSATENAALISLLGWLPGKEAETALLDLVDSSDLRRFSLNALAARGPEIIPGLLAQFQRSPRDSQLGMLELCGKLADRRCAPRLLEGLRSADDEIVIASLEALAKIGAVDTYAQVLPLLGSSSAGVRQAAVNSLNSLGHPETARDITRLLDDRSANACEAALKVAAYYGFPECVDSILACCQHPDEGVRRTAIEHLPCLDDERVTRQLEHALAAKLPKLRAAAARALGEIEERQSILLLRTALDDEDVWVRYFGIRSVAGKNYPPDVLEKLIGLATADPAMQVRFAAIEALTPAALPTLQELASNEEEDLAIIALKVLAKTKSPDAQPTLMLAARAPGSRKQSEAIRALGMAGFADAVELLRQIALEFDPSIAAEAIAALGSIARSESIDALLEIMAVPRKRSAGIAALTNLGKFAVSQLAARFPNLPLDVRRAVVETLTVSRSQEAIGVLEFALADKEPAVRFSALAALAHIRGGGPRIPDPVASEGNS